jgi:hypothetical protein
MAYKEVSRVEIIEVIRQWQAGRGIREITRSTGISRNTIRKYVLSAQSCGVARDGPPLDESQTLKLVQLGRAGPREVVVPTDKVIEPFAEQIQKWIKDDHLKLTRIQELMAQRQCMVPYTCLRRYVTRPIPSRGKWRRSISDAWDSRAIRRAVEVVSPQGWSLSWAIPATSFCGPC